MAATKRAAELTINRENLPESRIPHGSDDQLTLRIRTRFIDPVRSLGSCPVPSGAPSRETSILQMTAERGMNVGSATGHFGVSSPHHARRVRRRLDGRRGHIGVIVYYRGRHPRDGRRFPALASTRFLSTARVRPADRHRGGAACDRRVHESTTGPGVLAPGNSSRRRSSPTQLDSTTCRDCAEPDAVPVARRRRLPRVLPDPLPARLRACALRASSLSGVYWRAAAATR